MAKKKLESKKELDFLKNLVENSPDGIHILDQTGDVIYCSQRFAVLLGYSYKEALNLNVRDWDRQFPVDQLVPVIKDLVEKPRMLETKHEKRSGEIIDVEIRFHKCDRIFRKHTMVHLVYRIRKTVSILSDFSI